MPDPKASLSPKKKAAVESEFDFALSGAPQPHDRRVQAQPKTLPEKKPLPQPEEEATGLIPVPQQPDREIEQEAPPLEPKDPLPAAPSPAESDMSKPRLASTTTPSSTLYYSNRKEGNVTPAKETKEIAASTLAPQATVKAHAAPPSMTTPTTTPASSSPSRTVAAPRTETRPAFSTSKGLPDYRSNMERQAKEQKSVGNLLAIFVYVFAGLFVLGVALALYGGWTISERLNLTMTDIKNEVARQNIETTRQNNLLAAQLNDTIKALTEARLQLNQQQLDLARTTKTLQDTTAALARERAARQQDVAEIKARLQRLDGRNP